MKTTTACLSVTLALLALAPVSAQGLRPEAANGALLGAVAGAVIGNNSGSLNHSAWKGAALGAVAGGLIGDSVGRDHERRAQVPVPRDAYVRRETPAYYGYSGRRGATDGLWLGGLAGAVIGRNSGSLGHSAWRGAAWGAGLGYVVGSVADYDRRSYYGRDGYDRGYYGRGDYGYYGYGSPRRVVYEQPAVYQVAEGTPQPAAQPAPQNVTIINNYYGNAPANPMSGANSLFGRGN